jgi:mannose-6-phosphate isomerase-like protein (cupin superfamily)
MRARNGRTYAARSDQLLREVRPIRRALVAADHRADERLSLQAGEDPGEFIWHTHPETDEVFIVLDGEMTIHLRDGDVALRAGEMFVVPRGVEHKPSATRECRMMLIEPAGTPNTGDAQSDRTAADGVWV